MCYGSDLRQINKLDQLNLNWLLNAYRNTEAKDHFFIGYFTNLAGTKTLQQQIEQGLSADDIRKSWQPDLDAFKIIRAKYLIYQ